MPIDIRLLIERPDALPTLTDWYRKEWAPYYGDGGPGDAVADLTARCHTDRLPIALIALDETRVVGTVALDRDAATNLVPSVVGLFVAKEHRRRGIATALIEAAVDQARSLGYREVYVGTTVLGELLLRLGWHKGNDVTFLNDEHGAVYTLQL